MTLTLVFTIENELYGLEIEAIQEIVENPPQHFVPLAAGVLAGAVNVHGRILAVIDLPLLLGIPVARHDHRQVVLAPEFESLVLKVSSILRIIALDLSELQPPEETAVFAVRGFVSQDDMNINMLDANQVIERLRIEMSDRSQLCL